MYICKNNNFNKKSFLPLVIPKINLMKKYIILFALVLSFFSCKKSNDKIQPKAEEIELSIEVDRYDKAFFETKPENLAQLKAKYPDFFPPNVTDAFLKEKMQNKQWRELYEEVEQRYDNFNKQSKELESVFKYMQFYYPKFKVPKVYTVIQEMDMDYKTLYSSEKNALIISLELYLGKDHKFYEYPEYIRQTFEPSQMMPDVVQSITEEAIKLPTDREFLSQMIYAGKQLYMKDILLPEYSDEDKICYTPEQLKWCNDSAAEIWLYFMEKKILYSTDPKKVQSFIAPAPFSKFGYDDDSKTPGRVGAWVGWQIVRSFMENNPNVKPQQMFFMDASEIFQKAKYKPAKK